MDALADAIDLGCDVLWVVLPLAAFICLCFAAGYLLPFNN